MRLVIVCCALAAATAFSTTPEPAKSAAPGTDSAKSAAPATDSATVLALRQAYEKMTEGVPSVKSVKSSPKMRFISKKLGELYHTSKDLAFLRFSRYQRVATRGYVYAHEMITGQDHLRRRLNDFETWGSEMVQIWEALQANEINGIGDIWSRFQGATCTGGKIKSFLGNEINSALTNLEGELENPFNGAKVRLNLRQPVNQLLDCVCSTKWDLGAAELDTFYNKVRTLIQMIIDGGDPTANGGTMIKDVIISIKAAIPKIAAANAACNSDCQTAYKTLIRFVLTADEAFFGTPLPTNAAAALPTASVDCGCGGSIQWNDLLDAFFPDGNEYSLVADVLDLFGESERDTLDIILDIAGKIFGFIDFTFSDGLLCGGACKAAYSHGSTIGIYATIYAVWPDVVTSNDWGDVPLPGAVAADRPSEAEIQAATNAQAECLCDIGFTKIFNAVEPVVKDLGAAFDSASSVLDTAETVSFAILDGTPGNGGFCGSGACTEMLASYAKALSGMIARALTTAYVEDDDETVWIGGSASGSGSAGVHDQADGSASGSGSAGVHDQADGSESGSGMGSHPPALRRALTTRSTFYIVDPSKLSKSILDSWFDKVFSCFCHFWMPGTSSDLFTYAKDQVAYYENSEGSINEKDVRTTIDGVFKAANVCDSNQCRSFFSMLFDFVDSLTGETKVDGESPCTLPNADKCFAGECASMQSSSSWGSGTSGCQVCSSVPTQMLAPLSHIDDEELTRALYWGVCSLKSDCPDAGVSEFVITQQVTLALASVDDFTEAKQLQFRKDWAEKVLNISGVTANLVMLKNIKAGSVTLDVEVTTASMRVQQRALSATTGLNAASISSKLSDGFDVTQLGSAALVEQTTSPSPPPADFQCLIPEGCNSPSPPGKDDDNKTMIIAIAAGCGGGVLLLILGLLLCFCCKKTPPKDTSTNAGVVMTGDSGLKKDSV